MKLIQISVHFEYTDAIDTILDRHSVKNFVRYPMVEGCDLEGKHFGNQVFPGNFTVVQAQVVEEEVDPLFEDLRRFREQKAAHRHLEAIVLPVERRL